jgi:4-amino-4-deoxy-L-arabinose transferase-like glycosyltransferase
MPLRSEPMPPRAALPRDVEIPALPGVGITWYDRGPRYWARRLRMSLLWALVLALIAAFDIGLFSAIRHSSRTGFAIFLVLDVALTVALLVWYAVRTVRLWNTASLPGGGRTLFQPIQRRSGTALSGFARLCYGLAMLLVSVAFLFFPGFFVLLFLTSLLPESATERHARLWVAQQLRERGYRVPRA